MKTATIEKEELYKSEMKKDLKSIKGKFMCHEPKGGSVKFSYRKYKGEPIQTYYLEDNEEYELPVGVVKHLNNTGWRDSVYLLDAKGNPIKGKGKFNRRFSFQPIDFI